MLYYFRGYLPTVVKQSVKGEGGLGSILETSGVINLTREGKNNIKATYTEKPGKFYTKRINLENIQIERKNRKKLLPMAKREANLGKTEQHLRTHDPVKVGYDAYLLMRSAFRENEQDNENKSCNLAELIKQVDENKTQLTAEDLLAITQSFLESVQQLKQDKKVHLDIKPENIIVKKVKGAWQAKLIDFGTSAYQGKKTTLQFTSGRFTAPEVIDKNYRHDYTGDAYSAGMVMKELAEYSNKITGLEKDILSEYEKIADNLTKKATNERSEVDQSLDQIKLMIPQRPAVERESTHNTSQIFKELGCTPGIRPQTKDKVSADWKASEKPSDKKQNLIIGSNRSTNNPENQDEPSLNLTVTRPRK